MLELVRFFFFFWFLGLPSFFGVILFIFAYKYTELFLFYLPLRQTLDPSLLYLKLLLQHFSPNFHLLLDHLLNLFFLHNLNFLSNIVSSLQLLFCCALVQNLLVIVCHFLLLVYLNVLLWFWFLRDSQIIHAGWEKNSVFSINFAHTFTRLVSLANFTISYWRLVNGWVSPQAIVVAW